MEGDRFKAGDGPITEPNKRKIGKTGQEKREVKMFVEEVRERPAVIDTQGESGQWLSSLSCPQSAYGLEQTVQLMCQRQEDSL